MGKRIWVPVLVAFAFAAPLAWAGKLGWGPDGLYQTNYDPAKIESCSGIVQDVQKFIPIRGMTSGLMLTLKTEKESLPVHLGPIWFIDQLSAKFERGDRVQVKGARAKFADKWTIMAREVKKGDSVIKLREEDGFPLWSPRERL